MTDQQRYRLKEMAAQQSDLVDKLKALRKENEHLKSSLLRMQDCATEQNAKVDRLTCLLGTANEKVAELTKEPYGVCPRCGGTTGY